MRRISLVPELMWQQLKSDTLKLVTQSFGTN